MPRDHAELARARELGIPVIRRAEALAGAVESGKSICIAGTHGKTTTTVMTTEALAAAGENPTGIVGGRVAAWGGNLSRGGDDLVRRRGRRVRSLLSRARAHGRDDHERRGRSSRHLRAISTTSAARSRSSRRARALSCSARTTPARRRSSSKPTAVIVRYGIASPDARLVARDVRGVDGGATFIGDVRRQARKRRSACACRARHNVLNALAALGSGLALGVPLSAMAPGLAAFGGVERRFQRLGEVRGDDRDRRLRASSHRDSRDARGSARGLSRAPDRGRVPAASLLAHARLRRGLRRRARRRGRRSSSPRSTARARSRSAASRLRSSTAQRATRGAP